MRRLWILPIALVGAACGLSGLGTPAPGAQWPQSLVWFAHGLVFVALGWSLDLAVRRTWLGLPMYRRHLLLFALLVALGGLDAFLPVCAAQRPMAIMRWVSDGLGGGFGLALSCLPALGTRRLDCLGWVRGQARRPEPKAPLILVADPHWSTELLNLEETRAAHPEADWLFLGDVFDAWVGIEGMASPLQVAFLAWVDACRRSGRWVGLWLGNREFFLDPLSSHFDLMGEGTGGALPQEGLAWEHGDLVNASDWRYRLWNLISRSGPMWLFAQSLPKAAARGLARWLHRALHTTNQAYKLTFPREAFRAAAAEHPSEVFITGHFHTHEEEGNGIALPWAHEGSFMVWQNGQVQGLIKPLVPEEHQ